MLKITPEEKETKIININNALQQNLQDLQDEEAIVATDYLYNRLNNAKNNKLTIGKELYLYQRALANKEHNELIKADPKYNPKPKHQPYRMPQYKPTFVEKHPLITYITTSTVKATAKGLQTSLKVAGGLAAASLFVASAALDLGMLATGLTMESMGIANNDLDLFDAGSSLFGNDDDGYGF